MIDGIQAVPELLRIGRARVPGGDTRSYGPADYWALHLFFADGTVELSREQHGIEPGAMLVTPAGAVSVYTTEEPLDHVFAHFRMGNRAGSSDSGSEQLHGGRLFYPPSRALEPAANGLMQALTVYVEDPQWAAVKLWDVLLALSHLSQSQRSSHYHPALAAAVAWIEQHLPEWCDLATLARIAGVSATHLNRLFSQAFGASAMRYLRNRRMELAHYLLTGTALSVSEVAYQVGIPDVHAFNKLCKRYYGDSPSALRGAQLKEPR